MARPETGAAAGETIELAVMLGDIADEIGHLAEKCTLLQHSLSYLLDKLDHPDLGAEIHMLQDVDRIQQTLVDLASILSVAKDAPPGVQVARDDIGRVILLESLRQRLGLSNTPVGHDAGVDDTEVTWL